MQLSYRLESVAKMVSKGSRVADIGCDHAYVSIYLVQNQIADKVIAMDVNKGPLAIAAKNITSMGMDQTIETRLSDGGTKLQPGEVDTFLIAGMGGGLIIKILSDSLLAVRECKELILQPQSEIPLVRKFLRDIGYSIIREEMLIDEGKYYVILKASNQTAVETVEDQEVLDRYGACLLAHKNEVLHQYLTEGLKNNERLIEELQNNPSEKAQRRAEEIQIDADYMKKGLSYYEM